MTNFLFLELCIMMNDDFLYLRQSAQLSAAKFIEIRQPQKLVLQKLKF